ncbi:hypothetical protein D9613_008162 [Agrocybe pediades]|uniref:Uncharacterized protein n=1 Tax=Agrocybe pediades TaxID=84607 RepID=A0A8H4VL17_9AGAR|nr:hypothetical protein D9613_008162 [Agrocybe pediades]
MSTSVIVSSLPTYASSTFSSQTVTVQGSLPPVPASIPAVSLRRSKRLHGATLATPTPTPSLPSLVNTSLQTTSASRSVDSSAAADTEFKPTTTLRTSTPYTATGSRSITGTLPDSRTTRNSRKKGIVKQTSTATTTTQPQPSRKRARYTGPDHALDAAHPASRTSESTYSPPSNTFPVPAPVPATSATIDSIATSTIYPDPVPAPARRSTRSTGLLKSSVPPSVTSPMAQVPATVSVGVEHVFVKAEQRGQKRKATTLLEDVSEVIQQTDKENKSSRKIVAKPKKTAKAVKSKKVSASAQLESQTAPSADVLGVVDQTLKDERVVASITVDPLVQGANADVATATTKPKTRKRSLLKLKLNEKIKSLSPRKTRSATAKASKAVANHVIPPLASSSSTKEYTALFPGSSVIESDEAYPSNTTSSVEVAVTAHTIDVIDSQADCRDVDAVTKTQPVVAYPQEGVQATTSDDASRDSADGSSSLLADAPTLTPSWTLAGGDISSSSVSFTAHEYRPFVPSSEVVLVNGTDENAAAAASSVESRTQPNPAVDTALSVTGGLLAPDVSISTSAEAIWSQSQDRVVPGDPGGSLEGLSSPSDEVPFPGCATGEELLELGAQDVQPNACISTGGGSPVLPPTGSFSSPASESAEMRMGLSSSDLSDSSSSLVLATPFSACPVPAAAGGGLENLEEEDVLEEVVVVTQDEVEMVGIMNEKRRQSFFKFAVHSHWMDRLTTETDPGEMYDMSRIGEIVEEGADRYFRRQAGLAINLVKLNGPTRFSDCTEEKKYMGSGTPSFRVWNKFDERMDWLSQKHFDFLCAVIPMMMEVDVEPVPTEDTDIEMADCDLTEESDSAVVDYGLPEESATFSSPMVATEDSFQGGLAVQPFSSAHVGGYFSEQNAEVIEFQDQLYSQLPFECQPFSTTIAAEHVEDTAQGYYTLEYQSAPSPPVIADQFEEIQQTSQPLSPTGTADQFGVFPQDYQLPYHPPHPSEYLSFPDLFHDYQQGAVDGYVPAPTPSSFDILVPAVPVLNPTVAADQLDINTPDSNYAPPTGNDPVDQAQYATPQATFDQAQPAAYVQNSSYESYLMSNDGVMAGCSEWTTPAPLAYEYSGTSIQAFSHWHQLRGASDYDNYFSSDSSLSKALG